MSAWTRRLVPPIAALLLTLLVAGPSLAHADLVSSDPENQAVLATPPTVIALKFSEGLDQGKSWFKLSGPDGAAGLGKAARDGGSTMTLDGLVIGSGEYTIKWTAAATDGHVARGTLSFSVSEPTQAPATSSPTPAPTEAPSAALATPSPTATAAAPTASSDASPGADAEPAAASGTDVLVPIALGLLLVAGVGAFVLRRSRGA